MANEKSYSQNKYKQKLEDDYEKKIVEVLEPFVGPGRVVARVTVGLDFIMQDVEEEIFDPEGTIRAQQVIENVSSSQGTGSSAGGVAGVDNNIQTPGGSGGNSNIASNSEGTNTVTNYEISKKIIKQKDNNYSRIKRITAGVSFDSSILKDIENKEDFLKSIQSIVQDTIGYDPKRGDNVTVKDFKFLGMQPLGTATGKVDADGNPIASDSSGSMDTLAMIKSLLKEFSEYIQYLIAAILLFVFYKKFIVNHEVVILGDKKANGQNEDDLESADGMLNNYDDEFDRSSAQGRLKTKVKSQILNNIEGLDEESAAKYEVLIEELDKEINNNPSEVANMIELLLSEGDEKFK